MKMHLNHGRLKLIIYILPFFDIKSESTIFDSFVYMCMTECSKLKQLLKTVFLILWRFLSHSQMHKVSTEARTKREQMLLFSWNLGNITYINRSLWCDCDPNLYRSKPMHWEPLLQWLLHGYCQLILYYHRAISKFPVVIQCTIYWRIILPSPILVCETVQRSVGNYTVAECIVL